MFASFGPLVGLLLLALPDTWTGIQDRILRYHQISALAHFAVLQASEVRVEFGLGPVCAFLLAGAGILGLRLMLVELLGNPYAALFELAAPLN